MLKARHALIEIINDWAERELGATDADASGRRLLIEVDDIDGMQTCRARINVDYLADQILDAIRAGKLREVTHA